METTKTIGFIGPGKIGLPICTNLVKAGYRVLGYRRSPMTEFAQMGGTPAGSPAQVGAEADIVFACLPNDAALDEVVQGSRGLVHSARPGQIVIPRLPGPMCGDSTQSTRSTRLASTVRAIWSASEHAATSADSFCSRDGSGKASV